MRRFLSLFMMLLLALRGLAGDVMAMESPAAHDPAHAIMAVVQHTQSLAHDMDGAAQHEHGQAHHAPSTAQQCGAADAGDCGSHDSHCTTCGLCHSAMGQVQWSVFAGPAPAAMQPPHGTDRFASIAPIALIKPPISAV